VVVAAPVTIVLVAAVEAKLHLGSHDFFPDIVAAGAVTKESSGGPAKLCLCVCVRVRVRVWVRLNVRRRRNNFFFLQSTTLLSSRGRKKVSRPQANGCVDEPRKKRNSAACVDHRAHKLEIRRDHHSALARHERASTALAHARFAVSGIRSPTREARPPTPPTRRRRQRPAKQPYGRQRCKSSDLLEPLGGTSPFVAIVAAAAAAADTAAAAAHVRSSEFEAPNVAVARPRTIAAAFAAATSVASCPSSSSSSPSSSSSAASIFADAVDSRVAWLARCGRGIVTGAGTCVDIRSFGRPDPRRSTS
jgi:hypothetical protein